MRSTRLGLDGVAGEFKAWRANRKERRLPEGLLTAAVLTWIAMPRVPSASAFG